MNGSKALLVTLAMTAGLLAMVVGLRGQYPKLAAEHWRRQLDTVPDEQAAILLSQVAELGEPGIPVLVEALGSERESVARAGKHALLDQLDRWRILRARASSPKLAVLAEALADRVGQFGPTARHDAADLATRILLWPLDSRVVDRSRVIGCCEKVFQATMARRGAPVEGGLAAHRPLPVEGAEGGPYRPPAADDPIPFGASVAELSRLPGGGLPIESLSLSATPGEAGADRVGDIRAERPRRLPLPSAARPLINTPQESQRLSAAPQRVGPRPESRPLFAEPPSGPTGARPSSETGQEDTAPRVPAGEPLETETVELMQWLDCKDDSTAARAQAELVRRGFTNLHLELARRLFDPDPEVRRQLARSLPNLEGVDAVPWLLRLARDPDPEVRLVAIGLIATTGDPRLLERIERIAREDPDPGIRRQAERIAQRRGQNGRY